MPSKEAVDCMNTVQLSSTEYRKGRQKKATTRGAIHRGVAETKAVFQKRLLGIFQRIRRIFRRTPKHKAISPHAHPRSTTGAPKVDMQSPLIIDAPEQVLQLNETRWESIHPPLLYGLHTPDSTQGSRGSRHHWISPPQQSLILLSCKHAVDSARSGRMPPQNTPAVHSSSVGEPMERRGKVDDIRPKHHIQSTQGTPRTSKNTPHASTVSTVFGLTTRSRDSSTAWNSPSRASFPIPTPKDSESVQNHRLCVNMQPAHISQGSASNKHIEREQTPEEGILLSPHQYNGLLDRLQSLENDVLFLHRYIMDLDILLQHQQLYQEQFWYYKKANSMIGQGYERGVVHNHPASTSTATTGESDISPGGSSTILPPRTAYAQTPSEKSPIAIPLSNVKQSSRSRPQQPPAILTSPSSNTRKIIDQHLHNLRQQPTKEHLIPNGSTPSTVKERHRTNTWKSNSYKNANTDNNRGVSGNASTEYVRTHRPDSGTPSKAIQTQQEKYNRLLSAHSSIQLHQPHFQVVNFSGPSQWQDPADSVGNHTQLIGSLPMSSTTSQQHDTHPVKAHLTAAETNHLPLSYSPSAYGSHERMNLSTRHRQRISAGVPPSARSSRVDSSRLREAPPFDNTESTDNIPRLSWYKSTLTSLPQPECEARPRQAQHQVAITNHVTSRPASPSRRSSSQQHFRENSTPIVPQQKRTTPQLFSKGQDEGMSSRPPLISSHSTWDKLRDAPTPSINKAVAELDGGKHQASRILTPSRGQTRRHSYHSKHRRKRSNTLKGTPPASIDHEFLHFPTSHDNQQLRQEGFIDSMFDETHPLKQSYN